MGCSGAGCSAGLLGTICFAPAGAACSAVSHSAKNRSAASVEKAENSATFLLFILDSSRNESQPNHLGSQAFLPATSSMVVPKSLSITTAALRPGAPVTEPPGCVVAPV